MKKIMMGLTVLTLTLAPVKKANAGIIIMATGGSILGGIGLLSLAGLAARAGSPSPYDGMFGNGPTYSNDESWYVIAAMLLVADEDGEQIAQAIIHEYPTISPYAAKELEFLVSERKEELESSGQDYIDVVLTEEEAKSILELTEESSAEDLDGLYKLMTTDSLQNNKEKK